MPPSSAALRQPALEVLALLEAYEAEARKLLDAQGSVRVLQELGRIIDALRLAARPLAPHAIRAATELLLEHAHLMQLGWRTMQQGALALADALAADRHHARLMRLISHFAAECLWAADLPAGDPLHDRWRARLGLLPFTPAMVVDPSVEAQSRLANLIDNAAGMRLVATHRTEDEATDWLDANPGRWHVALLDVVLAHGSGFALIEKLRQQRPSAHVLVVSDYAPGPLEKYCYTLGANAVFRKAELDRVGAYLERLAA